MVGVGVSVGVAVGGLGVLVGVGVLAGVQLVPANIRMATITIVVTKVALFFIIHNLLV